MLENRPLLHSPISVASSPASPEPMSGTRNRPMLLEESPAPHYIMVEDSPAPQYIVVEEYPVPMSCVRNRPCLVMESPPKPTEDRDGTMSAVPMSSTTDRPSVVDDSQAVLEVNNLCCGGQKLVEGGSATLPINLFSFLSTTFPIEERGYCPIGGGIQRLQRAPRLFLLLIRRSNHLRWLMSYRNILWWSNPHRNARSRTLLVLSPLLCCPTRGLTWST